ncbi:FkbM family methyltransferase [Paenibacillus nanensis]|nr:FkbM family methyltransferase [Paenibacillus nanensis]
MHKITILGTKHSLYVNAADLKGASLIKYKGRSQPRVVYIWRALASRLKPDLVIDAGVNYGEIVLSAVYPAHAPITVIDANDSLRPYLLRSLREHPNSKQFRYVHAIASDQNRDSVTFYIDTARSGDSSAYHLGDKAFEEVKVPSVTVDSLIGSSEAQDKTLLFKLDVEGYEWQVLRGMSRLLEECREAAGCIEFNMSYLKDKGVDIGAYLQFLGERFRLYAIGHAGKLTEIKAPYLEQANAYFAEDPSCNDLLLVKSADTLNRLKR